MTGTFDGAALFGSKTVTAIVGRDFFLASYTLDGDPEWVVAAGGGTLVSKNTDWDLGSDLQIDQQGNIYVCGVFGAGAVFGRDTLKAQGVQDLFVAKYNPLGDLIWIKPFGGNSEMVNMEHAMEMVVNDRGDCYITGYFSGDLFIDDQQLQSQGQTSIFILALDASGRIKQFNQLFALGHQAGGNDPI
jgi:hypothetical protein